MSEFRSALESVAAGHAVVPEGWGQGRATFGGMVAAMMYHAVACRAEPQRPLRSMMLSFIGPVAPGPLALEVTLLRAGKSTSQWQCTARQEGQVLAVMLVAQGAGRESAIVVEAAPAAPAKGPDEGFRLPQIPGLTPDFARHFEFSWTEGDLPFSGSAAADIGGWMRFRDEPVPATIPHLLALVDAWPPAVLPMMRAPAPSSSLTWSLEMVCEDLGEQLADQWWHYRAHTDAARDGYVQTGAHVHDGRGKLVAVTRQTVTVFA